MKYKLGICNSYLKLLLMDKNRGGDEIYGYNIKSDLKIIIIEILSKHVNVYLEGHYFGKQSNQRSNIFNEHVNFLINKKFWIFRKMKLTDAIKLIVEENETTLYQFVNGKHFTEINYVSDAFKNEVAEVCVNFLNTIKSEISKTKHEKLIRIANQIKGGRFIDEQLMIKYNELFLELYNYQLNKN
jgi:hypothetical protein